VLVLVLVLVVVRMRMSSPHHPDHCQVRKQV